MLPHQAHALPAPNKGLSKAVEDCISCLLLSQVTSLLPKLRVECQHLQRVANLTCGVLGRQLLLHAWLVFCMLVVKMLPCSISCGVYAGVRGGSCEQVALWWSPRGLQSAQSALCSASASLWALWGLTAMRASSITKEVSWKP